MHTDADMTGPTSRRVRARELRTGQSIRRADGRVGYVRQVNIGPGIPIIDGRAHWIDSGQALIVFNSNVVRVSADRLVEVVPQPGRYF